MLSEYGIPFLLWLIKKTEDFHTWLVDFAEVVVPALA
jgi:hypothetical protein